MSRFSRNFMEDGSDYLYQIGTDIASNFCIGEIGSPDDFYLIGLPRAPECPYPILSGNFLNSEGKLLFRIDRNILNVNEDLGQLTKIQGDGLGYEVRDAANTRILSVQTKWRPMNAGLDQRLITVIEGDFYDKNGKLVVAARDDPEDGSQIDTKYGLGFNGSGFASDHYYGLSAEEAQYLNAVFLFDGRIHELVREDIENQTVHVDGKIFSGANLRHCVLITESADFAMVGGETSDCDVRIGPRLESFARLMMNVGVNKALSDGLVVYPPGPAPSKDE